MNLLGCLFVNLVEIYINLAEIYINLVEIYRWENDLVKSYARAYIFATLLHGYLLCAEI